MPQSLSYLLVHIVFSTKDRTPVLDAAVRPALQAYLATVARNAECECYRVGGTADHVHLAIRFSRTITTAKLVEELKTSSSNSMNGMFGIERWSGPSALFFPCGLFPGALPQAGIERAFGPVLLQINHPFREEDPGSLRPLVGDFPSAPSARLYPSLGQRQASKLKRHKG